MISSMPGREQYCAKFHSGELRGIAHCAATHKLATCGDDSVKLIDMQDWRVRCSRENNSCFELLNLTQCITQERGAGGGEGFPHEGAACFGREGYRAGFNVVKILKHLY